MVWNLVTVVELIMAALVIWLDLFIPTLVILAVCAISMLVRKERLSALGFKKLDRPLMAVGFIFLAILGWTLVQLGLIMPVMNHLTGTTQDLSAFEDIKGNVGKLIILLIATWTLAAFGEEIVYRGYLQARVSSLFSDGRVGIIAAVAITSALFGLAHTEQGVIGVVVTFFDAIVFSIIKLRLDGNLWGSILAHGLSNTIGIVAFFFIGPVYGLW